MTSRHSEEYQIIRSAPTASAKAWSWRAAVRSSDFQQKAPNPLLCTPDQREDTILRTLHLASGQPINC